MSSMQVGRWGKDVLMWDRNVLQGTRVYVRWGRRWARARGPERQVPTLPGSVKIRVRVDNFFLK